MASEDPSAIQFRSGGLLRAAADEARFQADEWPHFGAQIQQLAAWGSMAFLLAAGTDFMVLGSGARFWTLFLLRLAILALGIHLYRVGRMGALDGPRVAGRALLVFEAAVATVFLVAILFGGGTFDYYAIAAFVLVIAAYVYVPTLHTALLWMGPALTLAFCIVGVAYLDTRPGVLFIVMVLMLFANIVGWQLGAQLNRSLRASWLDRRRLRHESSERAAAEQRARAHEDDLQRLFETTPVAMLLTSIEDGRVLRYNQAAARLLDPENTLREGQAAFSIDHYVDPGQFQRLRALLARDGRVGPVDLQLTTLSGNVIDVMLSSGVVQYRGMATSVSSLVEITARKSHERAMEHLAETDMLTGLLNRRGFFDRAAAFLARTDSGPVSLAVLLLDADHFKRINDALGHETGDRVLKALAGHIQGQLRVGDVLGRLGGEEFACLLPCIGMADAMEIAERIREAVADASHDNHARLTVSIGVSIAHPGETMIDEALRRADRAMYAAKHAGRNRVAHDADAADLASAKGVD